MSNLSELLHKRVEEVSAAVAEGLLVDVGGLDANASKALLSGESVCPPLSSLRACSEALGVSFEDLRAAAEADGCEYDAEGFSISCPLSRRIRVAEMSSAKLKRGLNAKATTERHQTISQLFGSKAKPAAESVTASPEAPEQTPGKQETPEQKAALESLVLRASRGDTRALVKLRRLRKDKQTKA